MDNKIQMEAKSILHHWCAKKKLTPVFEPTATGSQHCQYFNCVASIKGIPVSGSGNAPTIKKAEHCASADFVAKLYKEGILKQFELTGIFQTKLMNLVNGGDVKTIDSTTSVEKVSVFDVSKTTSPVPTIERKPNVIGTTLLASADSSLTQDNASEHGNWDLNNAKSKLNIFFQEHKITEQYEYEEKILDNYNTVIVTRISFTFLDKEFKAEAVGSNKQTASKLCALKVVRQMFHLGVIEAYTGSLKKTKSLTRFPSLQDNLNLIDGKSFEASKSEFEKASNVSVLTDLKSGWSPWNTNNVFGKNESSKDSPVSTGFGNLLSNIKNSAEVSNTVVSDTVSQNLLQRSEDNITKSGITFDPILRKNFANAGAFNKLTTNLDIGKLNFDEFKIIHSKFGSFNSCDIFGYYIATILKNLNENDAKELQNKIISLVQNRNSSEQDGSTISSEPQTLNASEINESTPLSDRLERSSIGSDVQSKNSKKSSSTTVLEDSTNSAKKSKTEEVTEVVKNKKSLAINELKLLKEESLAIGLRKTSPMPQQDSESSVDNSSYYEDDGNFEEAICDNSVSDFYCSNSEQDSVSDGNLIDFE